MLSYNLENWDSFYGDCIPLWERHHKELRISDPLKPNVEGYRELQGKGTLKILTVRVDKVLIGYFTFILGVHLHSSLMCAFEDMYYLLPEERKGSVGLNLIRRAELAALDAGARTIYLTTSIRMNRSKIFNRLGYTQEEVCFCKELV